MVPGAGLFAPAAVAVACAVALRRGDLRAAAAYLNDPRARLSHHPATHAAARLRLLAARLAEARDEPDGALGLLDALAGEPGKGRWILLGEPGAAAWLVRVATAAGERARAERVADAAERLALDNPDFPGVRAAAAHARGLLDRDPAALAVARESARDAWARASAAEDLGVTLDAAGRRRPAIAALNDALAAYQATDAERDAARLRRRLRRLGVRHRHWAHAERPVSGWDSLTGTERAVSLLVAEGHTNRQVADRMFLSVHTVAFHLRQVFRKLGVHSRVELTRLAVEREPSRSPRTGGRSRSG